MLVSSDPIAPCEGRAGLESLETLGCRWVGQPWPDQRFSLDSWRLVVSPATTWLGLAQVAINPLMLVGFA